MTRWTAWPPRARAMGAARAAVAVMALLVATACSGGSGTPTYRIPAFSGIRVPPRSPGRAGSPALPAHAIEVVAVGDIACPPTEPVTTLTCQQAATGRLAYNLRPARVLTLGDEQYETGNLAHFESSYDASWGQLKDRTDPLPGNHEYGTPGAAGYDAYFGQRQPGYYAVTLGSWRAYLLNSSCHEIDCGREERWLRRQLTAHPSRCSLIAMHYPRYSSGSVHGSQASMTPFWQIAIDHHVDLALAGHEHDYERFVAMDAHGHATPAGMVSFVVGTGGKSLYSLRKRLPGSAAYENTEFGVLVLWLGAAGFAWEYRTIGDNPTGVVRDSGSGACHP